MSFWLEHLPVLPILIPLIAGALIILTREAKRLIRLSLGAIAMVLQVAIAVLLIRATQGIGTALWPENIGVYLLGNWPAPFGIVVVADRLSALMLGLTSVLGLCAWVFATARWDRAGSHFHSMFLFLMMGLNGAFLAGDLFNLFVFFEILLTASYGLMLHGSGKERIGAGLHYIAVNLVASFFLLIAIAIIYGVTGTLNLADLAQRAQSLIGADRALFDSAAAILGIAFLIKAAAWPLNFWLPKTYSNSSAPVAAIFAIMTKVGIYAILRIGSLLLPADAPAAFSGAWMFPAGIATLVFGTIGMLASTNARRITSYALIASSGTLFAALGMPGATLTGSALYYLLNSVLAVGTLFLLLELTERSQSFGSDVLAISQEAYEVEDSEKEEEASLSEQIIGIPLPATMAFLSLSFFICALLLIGLPPLSGFVAKFSLLSAALRTAEFGAPTFNVWLFVATLLASGLACLITYVRCGIRLFWIPEDLHIPALRLNEAIPIMVLIFACIMLTVRAGAVIEYLEDTALYLDNPSYYINAVLGKD